MVLIQVRAGTTWRPEEVPFDLAAELHIKGPDSAAVAYRRAMAELGVIVDSRDAQGLDARPGGARI
jgi:hypothetical protein